MNLPMNFWVVYEEKTKLVNNKEKGELFHKEYVDFLAKLHELTKERDVAPW